MKNFWKLVLSCVGTVVIMFAVFNTTKQDNQVPMPGTHRYIKMVDAISDKYKVDRLLVHHIVNVAVIESNDKNIDPTLTLAIIATESGFNPHAYNPSSASGLMQVMMNIHSKLIQSLGGSVFDPTTNIKAGLNILDFFMRLTGNEDVALNKYGGDPTGQYSQKVKQNKQWLKEYEL